MQAALNVDRAANSLGHQWHTGLGRTLGLNEVEFATKLRQMIAMLARALDTGMPFAWFTEDDVYGRPGICRAGFCSRIAFIFY